jgi:hypothetical protein
LFGGGSDLSCEVKLFLSLGVVLFPYHKDATYPCSFLEPKVNAGKRDPRRKETDINWRQRQRCQAFILLFVNSTNN